MKRIVGIILVLIALISFSNIVQASSGDSSLITSKKKLLSDEKVNKVLSYREEVVLYEASDQIGRLFVRLSVSGKVKFSYEIRVTAFYEGLNSYYIGGIKDNETGILEINKTTYKTKYHKIETSMINSIKEVEGYFILSGAKNNDGWIMITNLDFEILKEATFGGAGKEEYQELIITDDHYILMGEKDADSLTNVGNVGEEKVFLTLLNKELELIKHEYLNFLAPLEKVIGVVYQNDLINVLIKASNTFYMSQFDSELKYIFSLNLNEIYQGDLNDGFLVSGYEDALITVFRKGSYWSYGVISSVNGKDQAKYLLDIEGKVLKAEVRDGVLAILTIKDEVLYLYQIDNYEENIETFIGSKEYFNVNDLDGIGVKSHFGKVGITRKSISPYFSNSIPGDYLATYEITLPSGRVITKIREVKIYPYVNVADGGIYPTNYTLDFFGHGKLNGVTIPRNKKVTTPGNYTLTLTNNIGESETINFQVVDNYLKNTTDNIQKTDFTLAKGENFTVELPFRTTGIIKSIEVNNMPYDNFSYQNDRLVIQMTAPNIDGVFPYVINKVVIDYGGREVIKEINQVAMVRVIKESPSINITSDLINRYTFNLSIDDPDQTLVDLVLDVHDNGVLKSRISSLLQNVEYVIDNVIKDKRYDIKLVMKYHLGDGEILEKTLLEFATTAESNELDIGSFKILKQSQTLEELSFTLKTKDIQKLKVGGMEEIINNSSPNYQAIIVGVIMVFGALTAGVIINRKRKVVE